MTAHNSFLASRLRRAAAQLPYLPRALALVWTAAPGWTAVWAALLVVQGLLPAATVYLTRTLVNSLVRTVGAGLAWATLRPVVLTALLIGGVMLASQLLGGVAALIRLLQGEVVGDYLRALVHRQSVALDLAFYDLPEYYDHLYRARNKAAEGPVSLLENTGSLIQNGVTLVTMAAILLPYGAWLPVSLLASTLPALYVVLRYRAREHQRWLRTTADERRTWYYDWLLTARDAAAELRLFALGERFAAAYQAVRRRLRAERIRLGRDEGLARLLAGCAALLLTGGVMAWMVWRAAQGQATLGDLALFYAAFNQGQGLMRALLESLGQIYSNSLFLSDLFEFLGLQPKVVDPPVPAPFPGQSTGPGRPGPAICFRDVTFRYRPGGRAVLQHLNLTVAPGQIAAIVGVNGAGKSTLIKLLCRFYDPEAGCVEIDGLDARELSLAELRRSVTVLFQEPLQFNGTAAENISLGFGEVEGPGRSDEAGAAAGEAVVEAARAAGAAAPIDRLPKGYDTLLGTWFEGGTDLSVGEWQRIALARAFLRRAPILVLDEPTSAMDSWAEADWLGRFRTLAAGRTAIIITHRFTTARLADTIHVMDAGCIVESGCHDELLALGGRYASSWQAQMAG